jgi:hypothetical protein
VALTFNFFLKFFFRISSFHSLPMNGDGATINTRYMPTLGNGYLGLTVFDDGLFLNGLYSGTGGTSYNIVADTRRKCLSIFNVLTWTAQTRSGAVY